MIKSFVDGKWIGGIERELKLLTGKACIHHADANVVDQAIKAAKRTFHSSEWKRLQKKYFNVNPGICWQ